MNEQANKVATAVCACAGKDHKRGQAPWCEFWSGQRIIEARAVLDRYERWPVDDESAGFAPIDVVREALSGPPAEDW